MDPEATMTTLADRTDRSHPGLSGDAGSSCARADGDVPDAGVPAPAGAPPESLPGTDPEALELAASVAGPAVKPRILDTLPTTLQPPGIAEEFGGEKNPGGSPAVLPGQRELGLEGYRAQLGLWDGLGYAVPDVVHDPDELAGRPPAGPAGQMAFEFQVGGVQMGIGDWHRARDAQLDWLAGRYPRGKVRRTLRRRVKRGSGCGRYVRQRICSDGHAEAETFIASSCESRTCATSARADALELRRKLYAAVEQWKPKRRGRSWFLHTVTVRRPPWTSIERLRIDRCRAFRGWRAGWKLIRKFSGGKRAQLRLEVGTGGMVHVHILAHHYYLVPDRLMAVRAAILEAVGGGTTQYRVDRIRSGHAKKGGVKEVAKYLTKGVAMNNATAMQTHPLLAAMIEAAYLNRPIAQEYGDWDELDLETREEAGWHCTMCGDVDWHWRYLDTRTGKLVEEVPGLEPRGPPGVESREPAPPPQTGG